MVLSITTTPCSSKTPVKVEVHAQQTPGNPLPISAFHFSFSFYLFISAFHFSFSFHLFISAFHFTFSFQLFISAFHFTFSFQLFISPFHFSFSFHLFISAFHFSFSSFSSYPRWYCCAKHTLWSKIRVFSPQSMLSYCSLHTLSSLQPDNHPAIASSPGLPLLWEKIRARLTFFG